MNRQENFISMQQTSRKFQAGLYLRRWWSYSWVRIIPWKFWPLSVGISKWETSLYLYMVLQDNHMDGLLCIKCTVGWVTVNCVWLNWEEKVMDSAIKGFLDREGKSWVSSLLNISFHWWSKSSHHSYGLDLNIISIKINNFTCLHLRYPFVLLILNEVNIKHH